MSEFNNYGGLGEFLENVNMPRVYRMKKSLNLIHQYLFFGISSDFLTMNISQ